MKKRVCFALILILLLGSLTACNFTQNMAGVMAGEAECTPKVEEMVALLADNRVADAKALMHPQASGATDAAISQMSGYLAGRKASAMEVVSLNINTSTGTSGQTRQEQVGYKVNLNDGTVIYMNVVYLSNNAGQGFVSFQLVLGVV